MNNMDQWLKETQGNPIRRRLQMQAEERGRISFTYKNNHTVVLDLTGRKITFAPDHFCYYESGPVEVRYEDLC